VTRSADEDLIARCLDGNDEAFAELVDTYKGLVFGVISQVARDKNDVHDLAQNVFVRIHRGLPGFRRGSKLSTWIYRIIMNVCHDAAARERPHLSLDERDAEGRLRHEPSAEDKSFRTFELSDALERAIASLPVEQRFLISAYYFGGQQYQELADILEMPMGTVKTHLHRAKARLRALLEPRDASHER
jgi:RNA polymerase sigma-70 factor, ECF subfamily